MDRARKEVIGKYRNPEDVKATLQRLERDGYAREDVTIYTNNSNVRDFQEDYDIDMLADETRVVDKTEDNRSFWDTIKDMVSYNDDDEHRMTDEENELIAPYRNDIDEGYTVIAVREGISNLKDLSDTDKHVHPDVRENSIREAGERYHPHEEGLTDTPVDHSEIDTTARTHTIRGQSVTDLDADRNVHSNLDVIADEERPSDTDALSSDSQTEINLEDNIDSDLNREFAGDSTDHDTTHKGNESDSVLDRDMTNKDDTIFDDPNPIHDEGETFVEPVDRSPSDEMEKREEDYNRLDPDNDIRYDPEHKDMDL